MPQTARTPLPGTGQSDVVRKRSSRKDEILAVGARLFYERGYVNATLKDVAGALGMSAPAIYRHFSGKQDLLRAVLLSSSQRFADAVASEAGQTHDLDSILHRLAEASVTLSQFWEVRERDARHLRREDRDEISRRMHVVSRAVRTELGALRPELSPDQSAVLTRAVLAVFTMPSAYGSRAQPDDLPAMLARIARRIVDTPASRLEPRVLIEVPTSVGSAALSKRERVLHEATRLFGEHGYESVSMEDLGQAVGMSAASLYHYYSGKAEIFTSIFRRGLEWLAIDRAHHPPDDASITARMRAFLESYTRLALTWHDVFVLFVRERAALVRIEEGSIVRSYRDYFNNGLVLLREARPDLSAREARGLLACVVSVINDLAITPQEPTQGPDPRMTGTVLTDIAFDLLDVV
ncbi:TetR/AcrR family transcriptional regulator [Microbacterium sp. No. 7]|uniref:TetR/AcrR family transcriptional regulator n=1 Tax=Microbacterium sp. No. 7 TaxID=1714373 RepID=UPI0006CFBF17|nr:TetR/AcrR family transcriptional regulator [Microbacterium sp. No. 7]ALJ21849.1 hypothetical protein AOA12_18885 [Microbacterium sp. No. 7]